MVNFDSISEFSKFVINILSNCIYKLLVLYMMLEAATCVRRKKEVTESYSILQVHISQEHLQLEPIGLVFVFFFALILIIQFVAMLFHRFGTISHILSSTELNCCNKKVMC